MNKSQMRISPTFFWLLASCFLFALTLSIILPQEECHGKRTKIVVTKYSEKLIASALKQRAAEMGGLTNIDNGFVSQTVFNVLHSDYGSERTNSQGRLLDIWEMPYQIQIVARTNFIIQSAGPNKKFGDKDDIIFNSVSNDFVKP
jgi:hypothetical protein